MTMAVDNDGLSVYETFPQVRPAGHYFAEFGTKLPQKLKNKIPLFLLFDDGDEKKSSTPTKDESTETQQPELPAVADNEIETEKHKKKKRKQQQPRDDEPPPPPPPKEEPPKAPSPTPPTTKPKKPTPVDEKHKLYMKATLSGALGQKGDVIEAHNIPNGVLLHLIKGHKYVKTMIYYENFWYDYSSPQQH